ncbi:TetR/AcrR family transcriptional regulator [Bordetella sp. BOR01]|uniref:TetR/AcrR family transcriptional regulator n=1 Tax=Bordetella sp. BOR01 TaxID=2854779 RepID=UPI001C44E33A|nr:TetR/AcrR family transcriptional regulator [Bordetella sp. BOR01]MBV7481693.1 TetR/AcrR family transcriptional regulator [Bordetella sp. BOR01]
MKTTSAKKTPGRWQGEVSSAEEQYLRKRAIIVREAGRLFSANGFHNTSLDDIALQLGVTKTSIYHYFKNKNDVLLACFDVGFDTADRALDMATAQGGTGLDQMSTFVLHYTANILAELGACAAALELKSVPADEFPAIRKRMRAFDHRIRAVVLAGIADGSIADMQPMLFITWVMAAVTTLPKWFQPDGKLSAQEVSEQYAQIARRMLVR